jgi:hypothetical protein
MTAMPALRRRSAGLVLAALAALIVSGCGLSDPYNTPERVEQRNTAGERPVATQTPAGPVAAPGAPEEALEKVALASGNWTSRTVKQAYERALTLTTGQASQQLRGYGASLAASVAANPAPLTARAVVEAVVVRGTGDRRSGLIVTREALEGAEAGAKPRYQVTVVRVERAGARWVVSEWSPQ